MSCNGWESIKLEDAILFNPRETIKKSEIVKKIAMDKLEPYSRKISGYEEVAFTSGTKFRNGDTLLARITPCLENGKTAQVDILGADEVAFGSTEFIVMREKVGITINDFVYYLAISPSFRDIAIKSMNGSSGRQRIQKSVLDKAEIFLPSLKEQRDIADVLISLDKKIDLNNEMNKTLEEMAQALFKRWFIDFEFPNEEGLAYKSNGGEMVESELGMIPKGWNLKTVNDICSNISKGTTPTMKDLSLAEDEEVVNFFKVKDINDKGEIVLDNVQKIPMSVHLNKLKRSILKENDILFSIAGTIGRVTFVQKSYLECNINQAIAFIRLLDSAKYFNLLFSNLKSNRVIDDINSKIVQGVQANISLGVMKDIKIVIPTDNMVLKFNGLINPILSNICELQKENKELTELRDSLLPKLMSGEIRVEDIEANL